MPIRSLFSLPHSVSLNFPLGACTSFISGALPYRWGKLLNLFFSVYLLYLVDLPCCFSYYLLGNALAPVFFFQEQDSSRKKSVGRRRILVAESHSKKTNKQSGVKGKEKRESEREGPRV
ncbi:hypothetical protein, unlikely [Trypanosoma brucei gambiense DAL972]|uniref:Uncharacterized protein n=1 Tax=Trypanosoma brucei gambiense (strain MHOM/CI/86/DAL972) TaxID=679716 RepID=C9ZPW5_TRYB9|nr:hypothetical protein, unlikely [Trypanosoma brucei gambiense DAL972]CBH11443.1 hypothetical protein, unlikely [Trypanosoma brucei gambiense DAL972]|eukprot:XP_011773730.1 hypothetical protein, unlikely [Trypanosoma brucei gambiense DAL972]